MKAGIKISIIAGSLLAVGGIGYLIYTQVQKKSEEEGGGGGGEGGEGGSEEPKPIILVSETNVNGIITRTFSDGSVRKITVAQAKEEVKKVVSGRG